ncbi:phage terminase small subunit P27 family [Kurthia populi]|uniref:Phage terminase small subunit P27 family n=1 Tax=Kurthia populi TaxID=1562132 RepID=A0ABW5Y1C4_9BACL
MARMKIGDSDSHYTKEEREQRQNANEKLFDYQEMSEKPPAILKREALKEWKRIVATVKQDMPWSENDYQILVAYCLAVKTMYDAQQDLNKRGLILDDGKSNPAVRVQSQAIKDMRSCAQSLAMTLDGRLKVELNKPSKELDPFEVVMNE